MTISLKTEYVVTSSEVLVGSSRRLYSQAILLSLVSSYKQRDRLVGFSLVSEHQHAAMLEGFKAHKAPAFTNDVFDLPVEAFCYCVGTSVFPSVEDIGHMLLDGLCCRVNLRYFGASC